MSENAADREPTVIKPTPEGARRAALAADMADVFDDVIKGAPQTETTPGPDRAAGLRPSAMIEAFRFGGEGVPAVVSGAAPLLNLAHALRDRTEEPDVAGLRDVTVAAVKSYERDLAGARIAPDRARAAHYIICATIDDVILSQPWGVRSGWARSGLVSTFHMDVTGGDRVFDLLDHFHRNPGANKDVLLLIYLCLSLAFEGRTRVSPRGALELAQIRDGLYRTLRGQYGAFEREFSPHWRGVSARHKPLRTATALWALLGGLLLFLLLGYLLFTLALNRASDVTLSQLASLAPAATPSLAAIDRPAPPPPAEDKTVGAPVEPPPPPPLLEEPKPPSLPFETFSAFLKPEVDEGLVTLDDQNGAVLVRIRNAGMFETGSAEISERFRDLLNRIGGALASERYRAVVIGHTDNVPIRTIQYPSNWHLSEARARAVSDILAGFAGREAITFEGRAEAEPIADNATPEGRDANRRTEVLVITEAAQGGFVRRRPAGADAPATSPAPAPGEGVRP